VRTQSRNSVCKTPDWHNLNAGPKPLESESAPDEQTAKVRQPASKAKKQVKNKTEKTSEQLLAAQEAAEAGTESTSQNKPDTKVSKAAGKGRSRPGRGEERWAAATDSHFMDDRPSQKEQTSTAGASQKGGKTIAQGATQQSPNRQVSARGQKKKDGSMAKALPKDVHMCATTPGNKHKTSGSCENMSLTANT